MVTLGFESLIILFYCSIFDQEEQKSEEQGQEDIGDDDYDDEDEDDLIYLNLAYPVL